MRCAETSAQIGRIGVAEARTRVGTALSLLELAAQVLEGLPEPESALEAGDPELFRYLQAGATARGWLVGQGEEDSLECPAASSAFGDGLRVFGWTEEETTHQFQAALRDWREQP